MVLGREIASDASASQDSRKYAGSFSLAAEAKGETTPVQLETALLDEIRKIAEEPIAERELEKVKNQITASAYRRLASGFYLLIQLLLYDGLGDWQYLNQWTEKTLAVSADEVKRVAEAYLDPAKRTVALYYRKVTEKAP
jgi:zinc protease